MSTTDEALKKELWAAIYESRDLNGHDRAPTSAVVAAVLPIIRKAQADALRDAADGMGEWGNESVVVAGDAFDEDTWVVMTVREWLTACADEIEETTP